MSRCSETCYDVWFGDSVSGGEEAEVFTRTDQDGQSQIKKGPENYGRFIVVVINIIIILTILTMVLLTLL